MGEVATHLPIGLVKGQSFQLGYLDCAKSRLISSSNLELLYLASVALPPVASFSIFQSRRFFVLSFIGSWQSMAFVEVEWMSW